MLLCKNVKPQLKQILDKIFNAINNAIDQLEKQEKGDIVKAHAMPSSGLDTG